MVLVAVGSGLCDFPTELDSEEPASLGPFAEVVAQVRSALVASKPPKVLQRTQDVVQHDLVARAVRQGRNPGIQSRGVGGPAEIGRVDAADQILAVFRAGKQRGRHFGPGGAVGQGRIPGGTAS